MIFFDPKTLDDKQLFEKIVELNKKMSSAHFFQMSGEIKDGLRKLADQLQFEFHERQRMLIWDMVKGRLEKHIESEQTSTQEVSGITISPNNKKTSKKNKN